jgi:alkylation response protein AidB-like acyl-CoA dehydrogenase
MRTARSVEAIVSEIESQADRLDRLADEADSLGRAPVELVDVMREIRVPMIKAPTEVGGDLLLLADQLRFFSALSYRNATAAWTGFNHAGASGIAGARLHDAGVAELFSADACPFMAAVSAPSGRFHRVDGGYELTGHWKYASGVPHSEFVLLTALSEGESPRPRILIVRAEQVTVSGEWDVMALKGTGSIDVIADAVFVPDHFTFDPFDPIERGGPMFALSYQGYVAAENLGFTLGVCQRFVDEIVVYARGKARGLDGRLADRGAFKYEVGKAQIQIEAAHGFGLSEFGEVDALFRRDETLNMAGNERLGGVIAYATELAVGAVTHLFHFAGAGALFNSSVLSRLYRDAVGSHQHLMASNIAYDRRGERMVSA